MEAFQFDLDSISSPKFVGTLKGRKPSDFIDASMLKELKGKTFSCACSVEMSLEANSELTQK